MFPLSSGCTDPVGSEILGPERWPMQPGVMLVGGFPRVAEREAALVATFEGSCCSKQVELLPVKTKYPHEK